MPQKTIYLSETDAALWDEVKASGQKSMSTLFVEYLRGTLDARDGFLHVLRAQRDASLRDSPFAVMFVHTDGAFMQPHHCHGLADLAQFLRQVGLTEKATENIKAALRSQESVSERLTLTQDKIALF